MGPTRSPSHVLAGKTSWPLPLRILSYWRAAARLANRIDVVDSHFALYGLLPVLATRLRSKPLVVHFQGPWAEESRVAGQRSSVILSVKRLMEAALYGRATRLVTLSEAFKAILVERYRVDPSRVEVIPPGVDLDRFRPGDRLRTRRHLGLSDDGFVAVVARRLDRDARRMGLDTLLVAWRQVVEAVPGATLLVIGDGSARGDLQDLAREVNISGSVRFQGRVDDVDLVTCLSGGRRERRPEHRARGIRPGGPRVPGVWDTSRGDRLRGAARSGGRPGRFVDCAIEERGGVGRPPDCGGQRRFARPPRLQVLCRGVQLVSLRSGQPSGLRPGSGPAPTGRVPRSCGPPLGR